MEEVRLALMGFGNVGRALAQMIIDKRAAVYSKYGKRLVVTAIATGSHGNLYNPKGRRCSTTKKASTKMTTPTGPKIPQIRSCTAASTTCWWNCPR